MSRRLNLRGYQKCMIGSKVTAIFLNEWIFPIGEVASGLCLQPAVQACGNSIGKKSDGGVGTGKGFKVPLVCLSSWNSVHPMHWPERAAFK